MPLSDPIADHFEHQAKACDALGSPFTARLCRLLIHIVDDTTATGRRIAGWPGSVRNDALALRICGGLHRLVLTGTNKKLAAVYPPHDVADAPLADAVRQAIATHDRLLHDWLDSPPQTNEIARSGMLLPGFLAIARETGLPLALAEIGASAGLNLHFDRFGYAYGQARWGDAASLVQLGPEIRGDAPPLGGDLRIVDRSGCDIAPVDVSEEAGRLRLRSYVWADQTARLKRLDGALAIAARQPLAVVKADAAAFVRERLATRPGDATFVVFHSIMWQYMPRETKDDIVAALAEAGAVATPDAPIARLRMEPLDPKDTCATLSLTTWPGGATRRLARCDYHGRWIEWLG
jgi:hypothetical protein